MHQKIYPPLPARRRVLIADDSAAFRTAVSRLLEQLSEVELVGVAADGEEALDLVENTRPDLVVMDLKMPRLDGLRTAIKLRAEFPRVRVIIISLHDSAESKAASRAAGAVRFIPKHRVRQELPDAIAELFPDASDPAEENLA
jgi:DNA-binding NarL/FixJ family response regulator